MRNAKIEDGYIKLPLEDYEDFLEGWDIKASVRKVEEDGKH